MSDLLTSHFSKASETVGTPQEFSENFDGLDTCLLYTSDAADDMQCVDLGGRRIIKKHV